MAGMELWREIVFNMEWGLQGHWERRGYQQEFPIFAPSELPQSTNERPAQCRICHIASMQG